MHPRGTGEYFEFSLNRRELFRLSALSTWLLTTACKTGSVITRQMHLPEEEREGVALSLSPAEYRTLTALCETFFPGDPLRPSALAIHLPRRMDSALYFAPLRTREQFSLALNVVEYGGIFIGYIGRFSGLPLERRKKAFQKLLQHPFGIFRTVGVAIKQVIQLYYYTHPSTWKAIHYEGPFMKEKPLESLEYYQELLHARLQERKDTAR